MRSDSENTSRSHGDHHKHSRDYTPSPKKQPQQQAQVQQSAGQVTLVVQPIGKDTSLQHLREIFGYFGQVKDVSFPAGDQKYRSKRDALIVFNSKEAANNAIEYMNGGCINGKNIEAKIFTPEAANRERSRDQAKEEDREKAKGKPPVPPAKPTKNDRKSSSSGRKKRRDNSSDSSKATSSLSSSHSD